MKIRSGIVVLGVLAAMAALIWERTSAQTAATRKPRPSAESWQVLNLPAGLQLSGHTVVWTGQKALIWGGRLGGWNGRFPTNQGWIFNPADNSMTAMSANGAPSARFYHTAVWTGSTMIVWGGQNQVYHTFSDGAIYDPATDTWSSMTGSGAPSPRCKHTAVWTGSRMIVWAGNPIDGFPFNDGKSYDPAGNTWSSIATAPLTGRSQHTAVWTGSKMIVWGGSRKPATYFADGAVYDPVANQWTLLPAGPLAGRDNHFATWTGSAMAVLGGSNATTVFADGALYQESPNNWGSLDLTGQTGRTLASGDFDGSGVLFWGGVRTGTMLSDGLNIDPVAANWQPMTGTGAPSPRLEHQAVWTGNDYGLLIVGGVETDYNQPCSVGIYRPALPPAGSLEVFITPAKAVTDGVKWRRVGTGSWRISGERENSIPVGSYDIEFQKPANWTGPDQLPVTINDGQTTRVDQEFTEFIDAVPGGNWMQYR